MEPQPQPVPASSLHLASFDTPVISPQLDPEGSLRWTYDIGAAIQHFHWMQRLKQNRTRMNAAPETATGELISNRGGLRVQQTSECGCGVTFQGKKADVHITLISVSRVRSKGHVADVHSNGNHIFPCNSILATQIRLFVRNEVVNEPGASR